MMADETRIPRSTIGQSSLLPRTDRAATSRTDDQLLALLDKRAWWIVHNAAQVIGTAHSLRRALRLAVARSTDGTLAQSITSSSNGDIVIPRPQLLRLAFYELVRGTLGPASS
jgi:hypothetical protein